MTLSLLTAPPAFRDEETQADEKPDRTGAG